MDVNWVLVVVVPAVAVVIAAAAVWAMLARERGLRSKLQGSKLQQGVAPPESRDEDAEAPAAGVESPEVGTPEALGVEARRERVPRGVGARMVAVLAAALIGVASSIALGIGWISGGEMLRWAATAAMLGVIVAAVMLKWSWHGTAARSLGVALIALLLGGASVGLLGRGLGVIHWYVVISGSMSPAVFGDHAMVECENCEYVIRLAIPEQLQGPPVVFCPNCLVVNAMPERVEMITGDRIFAATLRPPRRWDIIVFDLNGSETNTKRLIALPGETLRIMGGDVFINGKRVSKPPLMWPEMWDFVHDTSLMPHDEDAARRRLWRSARRRSRWERTDTGWQCETMRDEPDLMLFDAPILAENTLRTPGVPMDATPVTDTYMSVRVEAMSGEGGIQLRWQHGAGDAWMRLWVDGRVELMTLDGIEGSQPQVQLLPLQVSYPLEAGLMVRDGVVYLLVDGAVAASKPLLPEDLEPARQWARANWGPTLLTIGAWKCGVELGPIRTWRDVHYTRIGNPAHSATREPLTLGPDQMFVLGDNSPNSEDSRMYGPIDFENYQGIVLGRYLPVSRRHWFLTRDGLQRGSSNGGEDGPPPSQNVPVLVRVPQ